RAVTQCRCLDKLLMQLHHCQSQEAKALLSHPFGAWLLLFPGFVAALAKGITIACERRLARKQNQPSAAARINQCFLNRIGIVFCMEDSSRASLVKVITISVGKSTASI